MAESNPASGQETLNLTTSMSTAECQPTRIMYRSNASHSHIQRPAHWRVGGFSVDTSAGEQVSCQHVIVTQQWLFPACEQALQVRRRLLLSPPACLPELTPRHPHLPPQISCPKHPCILTCNVIIPKSMLCVHQARW